MALHDKIKRHYLIINKVRRPGFPTFRNIREMLEDQGYEPSSRTLQRDIENIRKDFGIEIRYNSFHNGYDIDYESSVEMDYLMKFLEMAVMTGTLDGFRKDPKEVKSYVTFDSEEAVKGVEFISRILFALKNALVVEITYKRFIDLESYQVFVKPGLLKEYQKRWYMIGLISGGGGTRAYALDRMQELRVGDEHFDRSLTEGLKERFDYVIGISHSDHKPELIKITFTTEQAPYIETLPWHPTQEVERKDRDETTFSYYVVPNYELIQKILAEGNNVLKIWPEEFSRKVEERRMPKAKK